VADCGEKVFLAMKNLDASELTITFVGDKAEIGLSANKMPDIRARGETRRVALAALEPPPGCRMVDPLQACGQA
jgi:hypothetical protein